MKVASYILTRNGTNAVLDWILDNLVGGTSYNLGYLDSASLSNSKLQNQDGALVKLEDFFKHELVFFAVENVDITEPFDDDGMLKIVVLRDFYNAYASFKSFTSNPIAAHIGFLDFRELWLKYAREFIGETSYLKNKVLVNYNKWFVNAEYRASILGNLKEKGLPIDVSERPYLKVARQGFGSSFDGFKFNYHANDMDVLRRYKRKLQDMEYVATCSHPEVQKMCKKIFNIDESILSSNKRVLLGNSMIDEAIFQSIFYY